MLTTFNIATDLTNAKSYEFIIPNELREGYNYVISYLRDKLQIIAQDSRDEYKTTEACCVSAVVGVNNVKTIKNLFAGPQRFINSKDISIVEKPKKLKYIMILLLLIHKKSMIVQNMPKTKRKSEKSYNHFKVNDVHLIRRILIIQFFPSFIQVKQLMTMAGSALGRNADFSCRRLSCFQ